MIEDRFFYYLKNINNERKGNKFCIKKLRVLNILVIKSLFF